MGAEVGEAREGSKRRYLPMKLWGGNERTACSSGAAEDESCIPGQGQRR